MSGRPAARMLSLGLRYIVFHAALVVHHAVFVKHAVGGAGIAVSGLAYGAHH